MNFKKKIYKNKVNELNDNISELKEELEDVKNNKIENDNEIIYE
jgi:predicted  nucleic acid-binding Zn-ribbon protein